MEFTRRTTGAIVTFLITNSCILIFESITGISLDPYYWLSVMFQASTNPFILMPTTGPFAQSTENFMLLISLFHIILRILPSIALAGGVYHLIPDE